MFKTTPVIVFRKNTSLKQIIGANTIRDNQKILNVKRNAIKGDCNPCDTNQKSTQTKEKHKQNAHNDGNRAQPLNDF